MVLQLKITFGDYNTGDFQKSKRITREQYEEFLPLMKDIMGYGRTKNKYNLSSNVSLEYNYSADKYVEKYDDYSKYRKNYKYDEFNEFMNFIHPHKSFDSILKFELLETKVINTI